jgi:hypothetical protein
MGQVHPARVGVTWRFLQLGPLYHREEGNVETSRSSWCARAGKKCIKCVGARVE